MGVEMYYPESGPGQQELSITHGPASVAADRQLIYRESVRAVALRHGLKGPVVLPGFIQAGRHGRRRQPAGAGEMPEAEVVVAMLVRREHGVNLLLRDSLRSLAVTTGDAQDAPSAFLRCRKAHPERSFVEAAHPYSW